MRYQIEIDSYIGYPITKQYVREKLAKTAGKPCAVRVNSYGGDVQTALDIRQQFIDHGDVTAYIFGMTASAATILAMGAKRVLMSRYALMLVHNCSGWVDSWGSYNARELEDEIRKMRETQADLETIDRVVVSVYTLRTGGAPEAVASVMRAAKWLTADECLKLGLIDGVIEEGEPAEITDAVREHFTACGIPVPDTPHGGGTEARGLAARLGRLLGLEAGGTDGKAGDAKPAPAAATEKETKDTSPEGKKNDMDTGKEKKGNAAAIAAAAPATAAAAAASSTAAAGGSPEGNADAGAGMYAHVAAVLGTDGVKEAAGGVYGLTAGQMKALDDRLAAAAAAERESAARIAELEAADGAEDGSVKPADGGEADSPHPGMSAAEMYKRVSAAL